MPPTETQSGGARAATPSRGRRREVLEDIARSVVRQISLDPAEVRALHAIPDQEGIAVQDAAIRSEPEVFSCA
ncbi:MAG: hypothetical protein ABIO48_01850 [Pedococcus sp.]